MVRLLMFIISGLLGLLTCKLLDRNKDNLSYDSTTLLRREEDNDNSNK